MAIEKNASLLIINPGSRNGRRSYGDLATALQALGPVFSYRVDDAFDINRTIERHRSELARIIIGGGDGTLHHSLDAVLGSHLPLGIIPLGTGNDYARSLSLPLNPIEAAKVIVAGHTRRVDVGMVNGVSFLNAVGIGLGPTLTRQLSGEKKYRLGVAAYWSSLVEVLRKKMRVRAVITCGDKLIQGRFLQITIANAVHYGGGMTIDTEARVDDGQLRVLCIKPQSSLQLLLHLAAFRWGRFGKDDTIHRMSCSSLEVRTRKPRDVTADGELVTKTPIRCESLHRVLTVYAPAEPSSNQ